MKTAIMIAITIAIMQFVGCAGQVREIMNACIPPSVSSNISTFDGTKEVHMRPQFVELGIGSSRIKFALFKNSKMEKEEIVLTASVKGVKSLEALLFNVDGAITTFPSLDTFPEIDFGQTDWSSNRFIITKDFLNKIIEAKLVKVKVSLGNEYVEGVFTKSLYGNSLMINYEKFLELIETI